MFSGDRERVHWEQICNSFLKVTICFVLIRTEQDIGGGRERVHWEQIGSFFLKVTKWFVLIRAEQDIDKKSILRFAFY